MKNAAVRIFVLLILIILSIFIHHKAYASIGTATDGSSSASNGSSDLVSCGNKCDLLDSICIAQGIDETKCNAENQECHNNCINPPIQQPSALAECQYQCITNAKQCLNQGTPETICTSENYKCDEQCAATGKPIPTVPPPANVPIPIPQPQESPELIACKHQCDVENKDCWNKGIDQNQCNKNMGKCNDKCTAEFPLIENQPSEESQLLDYGDAPDPTFPSLKASNGARHVNTQYEWLGLNVTTESDSRQIDLDDKDDGITMSNLYNLQPCAQVYLPVNVSVKSRNDPAHLYSHDKLLYLNMLFDWDVNGKWQYAITCNYLTAFEHAVVNYPIDVSNWPPGVTTQIVNVPLKTGPITQNIWVRATLTYDQKVNFTWNGTGIFNFGETEDYGPRGGGEPPPRLSLPSTPNEGSPSAKQKVPELPLPKKSNELPLSEKSNGSSTEAQETSELPLPKKSDGSVCHNNNECKSGICNNGICTVLVEQPTAQSRITISTIVQAITNFFSNLFGSAHKS